MDWGVNRSKEYLSVEEQVVPRRYPHQVLREFTIALKREPITV